MNFVQFMCVALSVVSVRAFIYSTIDKPAEVYSLPALPYGIDALSPWIRGDTVNIHYHAHHRTYTNNMNAVLQKWRLERPDDALHKQSIAVILEKLNEVPADYRMPVRNHGGGFVNHLFYWSVMSQNTGGKQRVPSGALMDDIREEFVNYDLFKKSFTDQAKSLFGSGYVWLVRDSNKKNKLDIISTANQDCPLTDGLYPILVIDVWEHAYYLDRKNQRAEYIKSWWHLVDWEMAAELDSFWKNRNSKKDEL